MWNYRIIRHKEEGQEEWLAIHEVFYDEDNDNRPNSCTKNPITIVEEDLESIKTSIDYISRASDKPILEYQYFLDIEKANEKCTCPKVCDCENPPIPDGYEGIFHISNECPIHNDNPDPNPDCPIHGNE